MWVVKEFFFLSNLLFKYFCMVSFYVLFVQNLTILIFVTLSVLLAFLVSYLAGIFYMRSTPSRVP